jgi:hypothetical protein
MTCISMLLTFKVNVDNLLFVKKCIHWEFDVDANEYKCIVKYC